MMRILLLAGASIAAWIGSDRPALGTERDWTITRSDCEYVLQSHERVRVTDRASGQVEQIAVRGATGTFVHAERKIEPSLVIEDLVAGIWIRADRRGIQLLGRIVFPKARDPATGRPATVLVLGEMYESRGDWRQLTLTNLPARMRQQTRVLRARLQQPIDDQGAYLDALVLNVFGGPGTTQVWVDEVELRGSVRPLDYKQHPATAPVAAPRKGPQLRVSQLTVDDRPFFPRIIDHRGESFESLRRLGFNSIRLTAPPTRGQQDEAQRLGLWLICPPPEKLGPGSFEYPSVLAWHLGDDLSKQAGVRRRIDALRRNDPRPRLLVAGTSHQQWVTSRQIDVLLRSRFPLGTSFPLSEFGDWLFQTTRLVRPGTPFWSSIQTELAAPLTRQARLFAAREAQVSRRVEMEQVRQLSLAALAAGSRGLWFRSESRLDTDHPDAARRRLILERLNIELALVGPWVMGGHRVGYVPCDNPTRRIVALTTERSRLLMTTHNTANSQYVSSAAAGDNALVVAGVPDSIDVYLLTPIGLRPVRPRRISGGLRIAVEAADADAMILMTEDPLVVSHINGLVGVTKTRAAILEYQIARDELMELLQQFEAMEPRADPLNNKDRQDADDSLLACQRLLESGDVTDVYRFAQQARRAVARIRRRFWERAIAKQAQALSLPTNAAFHLLSLAPDPPINPPPNDTLWPGGDCEDLGQMIRSGWRQHQAAPADLRSYLALSPEDRKAGQHCLRLQVEALTDEARHSVLEVPPVWVNSSPITVRPGQRVRITGWVRIERPLIGGPDGFIISDNVGGPELALRFRRTKGWQQFELIRAVDRHDHLTLTFALTGIGEVRLDDIRVQQLLDKDELLSQNWSWDQ